MRKPLVAGVGDPVLDVVGLLPPGAEPAGAHDLAEVTLQGGGRVPLALATATALGCEARLYARLGKDDFGRFVRAGLEEDGLDLTHCVTVDGQLSPFRFVAIGGGRRRAAYATEGDLDLAEGTPLDVVKFVAGAAVVVLDAHMRGAPLVAAAEAARAAGAHIIVSISHVIAGVGDLIPLASTLIATERFASEIAPRGEIEDSLVELQRLGPSRVIVTRGDAGALGLEKDTLVMQPTFDLPVVDPTGAPSVFVGALAAATALGKDFEDALELATAASCLASGHLGGRAGIPTADEVAQVVGWKL